MTTLKLAILMWFPMAALVILTVTGHARRFINWLVPKIAARLSLNTRIWISQNLGVYFENPNGNMSLPNQFHATVQMVRAKFECPPENLNMYRYIYKRTIADQMVRKIMEEDAIMWHETTDNAMIEGNTVLWGCLEILIPSEEYREHYRKGGALMR